MQFPHHPFFFLGIFAFPFAAGLLSSFTHCAGMCGPIHLFLARGGRRGLWLYHLGRILTYGLLGMLVGGLSHSVRLPGMAWAWILLYTFMGLKLLGVPLWPSSWGARYSAWFMRHLRPLTRLAADGSPLFLFLFGLAAGLLPCASTQAGLVWAAGTSHPAIGGAGMLLLGAGTLPLFLAWPRKWMGRGGWYHAALGIGLIVLASWKVYRVVFQHAPSCH